jgi:hypothetical protein
VLDLGGMQGGDLILDRLQPDECLVLPLGGITSGGGPAEEVGKAVGFEHERQAGEIPGHIGIADPRVQRLLQFVRPPPHLDKRLGGLRLVLPGQRQALPRRPQFAACLGGGPVGLHQRGRQGGGVGSGGIPHACSGPAPVTCLDRPSTTVRRAGRVGGECQDRDDGQRDDDAGS